MSEKKENYAHLAEDATVTVHLEADEVGAIFRAYDRGLDGLGQDELQCLNSVICKLKDQLWP